MSVFGTSLAVAAGFNGIVRASSTMMSGKVTTGTISRTATFGAGMDHYRELFLLVGCDGMNFFDCCL